LSGRLSPRTSARLLEQWAEVLATGMPLPQAVAALAPGERTAPARALLAELEGALALRRGLEPALSALRAAFGPGSGELLVWAEEQGRLERSLRLLAYVERRRGAYTRSWKLAIGPLLALQLLMAVVPNPLTGLCQIFLAVVASCGALCALVYLVRAPLMQRARGLLDRLLWQVPIVREPIRDAVMVRYFWILALATDSGISLQLGLWNARISLPNTFAAQRARAIERDLEAGARLNEALAAHLPVRHAERAVLAQGETAGDLPGALSWIAETRMSEIARTADRVSMGVVAAPYVLFLVQWLLVLVALAA
jgi:type II secretory pathway component PulF